MSLEHRLRASSLTASPLVAVAWAVLVLTGCGGSGSSTSATGGADGGAGKGGGGGTAGHTGTGGKTTGTGGGAGMAGAGGGAAGVGGQDVGGGGGGGNVGGVGGAPGGTAGGTAGGPAGGAPGGTTGGTGGTGGAAGGGTAGGGGSVLHACTPGTSCTLLADVKGICNGAGQCEGCGTSDAACATAYGAGNICVSGGCVTGTCHTGADCANGQLCGPATHTCAACTTDSGCQNSYGGANFVCVAGMCVAGNCHATADCTGGLICTNMTCSPCSTDGQCPTGDLCVGGACIPGNCHVTANCPTGQICDLVTHGCAICGTDAQCADPLNYGAGHYCQGSACVVGQCRTANDCAGGKICSGALTCAACTATADCTTALGANHVCTNGACVSGNCAATGDCGGGQLCKSNACVACALDADCTGDPAYGAQHLCVAGQCVAGSCRASSDCTVAGQICNTTTHTCAACASDVACKTDTTYGSTSICLASLCVTGDCHDTSADCTGGKICGVTTPHTCGSCVTDASCVADGRYGAGNICYQGSCGPGNCHATSTDCTAASAGLICGVSTTNTCGSCTTDVQCKSDAVFGSGDICTTATGANRGKCVSSACTTNSSACAANASDFCCGNVCVAGNCCADADCVTNPAFGVGYACKSNSCSQCAPASGNKFFVDPVNGNDQTATGSGLSGTTATPSCSFKTITRAIAVIGNAAPANTKIVVSGVAGQARGLAAGDTLPITLPPNVILTTATGPITITLATTAVGNPAGFRLLNAGSGIAGDPAAPLTLDGNGHQAGIGIQVAPGAGNTVTLSSLAIQNTGGHAINVTSGNLTIGAGVVVTGAGIPTASRDGLLVSGGIASIVVPAGQAQTSFNNNTLHGIEVSGLGSVNVTGVVGAPVPSNNGTVIVSSNTTAGLRINQTVGAANLPTNTITGLVAWANGNYGARIFGGSKVKIRKSVFGASGADGILVSNDTSANGTAALRNDLTGIDLGTSGTTPDPGLNYLQTPLGALGTNLTAGLCVGMAAGIGPLTLNAAGNYLVSTGAAQVNCSTTAATITKAGTCTGHNSLGGMTAAGGNPATVVTVVTAMCN